MTNIKKEELSLTAETKTAITKSPDRLDIVFTIVSHGKGEEVIDLMREKDVLINITCHGRGTAPSKILEMFGLGATEKDVILSFVNDKRSKDILGSIAKELDFEKPGKGIAFTVPLQSVAGTKVLKLLATASLEEDQ